MNANRLVLFTVLGMCLGLGCARGAEKTVAYVQGYDVLAPPGAEASLRAKVERPGHIRYRPDVHGEEVQFLLGDKLIGSARSAGDGIAEIKHRFEQPGSYVITLRLSEQSGYAAEPAPLRAEVCDPKTEFIITDIDNTIADVSWAKFTTTKNEDVPALPGSVEVLTDAAKRYKVVYVTARDDAFIKKTKDWLELRKFPPGPVFFWDFLGKPLSHAKYKTKEIAAIKKSFPNLAAGLGDRVGDAEAYLANGMKAIIISPKRDDDLPKEAVWVKDWPSARQALLPKE